VKEPYTNSCLSPKRPEMRHARQKTPALNTHTCPHIDAFPSHCNTKYNTSMPFQRTATRSITHNTKYNTKYNTSMPFQRNAAENCNTLAHDVRARVHKRTHSHTLYQTHTDIFLVFRKSSLTHTNTHTGAFAAQRESELGSPGDGGARVTTDP